MGHYYNPPPPFIGGAAPLVPRKRVPPSGPTPQNPFFAGTAVLVATVLQAWQPAPAQAQTARNLNPALFAAPAATPVLQRPDTFYATLNSWIAAPYQIPAGARLTPPRSGPIPQNPPFAGTKIQDALWQWWQVKAPPVQVGAQVIPATPIPIFVPIGRREILWQLLATWIPGPPQPPVGNRLPPSLLVAPVVNNPPLRQFAIPPQILQAWEPKTPPLMLSTFIVQQPPPVVTGNTGYTGFIVNLGSMMGR